MKTKRGFTIVELLLVTAILLIVMALSISLTFWQIGKAKNAAAVSTLSTINSMYRMSAAIAQADMPSHNKPGTDKNRIDLPADYAATSYEKFLTESMHEAFAALSDMKYSIVDENGFEAAGGIIITYWPKPDEYEHFIWHDGEVTRYFLKDKKETVSVSP